MLLYCANYGIIGCTETVEEFYQNMLVHSTYIIAGASQCRHTHSPPPVLSAGGRGTKQASNTKPQGVAAVG